MVNNIRLTDAESFTLGEKYTLESFKRIKANLGNQPAQEAEYHFNLIEEIKQSNEQANITPQST